MTFLQQTGAAVLLMLITFTIKCGGAAALIIWIRSIPKETQEVRLALSSNSLRDVLTNSL
jgi:hypothetical protein